MDDLRAIEQLKYRYLRSLDLKDWDEFAETLTEDVSAGYGPHLRFSGRNAVLDFLRSALGPAIITVHHCHHPEIDVAGDRATGTWYLDDRVLILEHRRLLTGAAFYSDEYVRTDGRWQIARTGYVRSYEAVQPLPDGWELTANRWADSQAQPAVTQ